MGCAPDDDIDDDVGGGGTEGGIEQGGDPGGAGPQEPPGDPEGEDEPGDSGADEPGASDAGGEECFDDADCDGGVCVDGECVPRGDDGPGEDQPDAQCAANDDCALGSYCDAQEGDPGWCQPVDLLAECPDILPAIVPLNLFSLPSEAIDVTFVEGPSGDHLIVAGDEGLAVVPARSVEAVALSASPDVLSVSGGDFDGDGIADLVAYDDAKRVTVYLGDGAGGFAPQPPIEIDAPLSSVAAARFEGLGTGLLVEAMDGSHAIHVADELGLTPDPSPLTDAAATPRTAAAGDVDGDGFDEVLIGGDSLDLFVGGPAPSYQAQSTYLANPYGEAVHPLLAQHESGLDVVSVATFDGWVHLQAWRGGGYQSAAVPGGFVRGASGDIDGDGDADLVLVGHDVTLVRAATAQASAESPYECMSALLPGLSPDAVAAGDLDGDRRDELALVIGGVVVVYGLAD